MGNLAVIPPPQAEALSAAFGLTAPAPGDPLTVAVGTLSLLAAAAEARPVLTLVDDAHWLDSASLNALVFAIRRLRAEGVAVLLAVREDVPPQLRAAGLPELMLEPLENPAARELVRRARASMAPEIVDSVLQTARGNPLALLQLPMILSDAQALGEAPLPDPLLPSSSLSDAFVQQLDALPDPVRLALVIAAAAGRAEGGVAARALSSLGLDAGLGEAERRGIVTLEGEIHFRHPLLRSVVYHEASPEERRNAHRVLARAFPADDRGLRRAWHMGLAASDPDEDVAATLERAAIDARLRSGYSAAGHALERAARLSPDRGARARRLVEAAQDFQLVGSLERASQLLEQALESEPDLVVQAEIHHMQGRGQFLAGSPTEAVACMVDAASLIEGQAPGRAATILAEAAYACLSMAEAEIGLKTAQRAHGLAETAQDESIFLTTIVLMLALQLRGETGRAEELLDVCLPTLLEGDPLPRVSWLVHGPALALVYFERYDDARMLLQKVIGAARARSAPGILPMVLIALGELDFRTGNWTAGRLNGTEAVQLAEETGQLNVLTFCLTFLARFDAVQGRPEAARKLADVAEEMKHSGYAKSVGYYADVSLARLAAGAGDYEKVVDLLETVERVSIEQGIDDPSFLQWEPDLIEAYVRTGRIAEGERSLARLELLAEKTSRKWTQAVAARCRGLMAGDGAFEQAFAEAREWHGRVPQPFEAARTDLCLGERLRRAKRRADARGPLRRALETFERLGAVPWAARARDELRASGGTPRSVSPSPLSELTPRELQVAHTIAEGATNREAASVLFLSPKTIDFHLQHIFRKLDIRSRTELARLLAADAGRV
jgi:DNA-binding NarL/FixJ family response regulator